MIDTPSLNWWAVAPEAVLALSMIVVLLGGVIARSAARRVSVPLSVVALAAAGVLAALAFDTARVGEWGGQIDSDPLANIARLLAIGAGLVSVALSARSRPRDDRDPEHYALVLGAVCGMGLLAASGSLIALFVGLELFSIALYVLCALEAERVTSLEAGLKYLIVGGMSSAILLYGCALVYGATGTLDLSEIGALANGGALLYCGMAMLVAALAFKISAAPLHWWTPDVYDGAPTPITAFMAVATKAAAFAILVRVLVVAFPEQSVAWEPVLAAIAVASIVVGNFGALVQQRLKRMLAYSSIAHAGYLLIGVVGWQASGIVAVVYGLAAYAFMTLGAFAFVMMRERRDGTPLVWSDLSGSGWSNGGAAGWLAALPGIAFVLVALSLAGIPPTGGFFAKFMLFDAAVQVDYAWLAYLGVLGSIVSLGYYLRIPVEMYLRGSEPGEAVEVDVFGGGDRGYRQFTAVVGVVLAAGTLAIAFAPSIVVDAACDAKASVLVGSTSAGGLCVDRDSGL